MKAASPVVQNLRHWTLHVLLSGSASFVYAYTTMWHSRPAVAGMLAGLLVFVVLYTAVWSSRWFQNRVPAGGLADRALLYGTWLRSAMGGVSTLLMWADSLKVRPPQFFGMLFEPDLFAGMAAVSLVERLGRTAPVRGLRIATAGNDARVRAQNVLVGDTNSLLPTFFTTLAEGVLLSLMLLALAAVCWVGLRLRAQRGQPAA